MSVIKEYRKKRKIKLVDLAKQIGVSDSKIKRWQRKTNVPTILEAERLCKALRLPFKKLLDEFKEEK